jgi:hypothetical protein
MNGAALFIGRARIRQRWRGHLGLALLLGITAGLSMLAIAGARRTQSAYPRFLRAVHVSTFSLSTFGSYDDAVNARIASLPNVVQSRTYVGFNVNILDADGRPIPSDFEASGTFDGRYVDQDRFTPLQGRAFDPTRADEIVFNEYAAERLGIHVGDHLELGTYTTEQWSDPNFLANAPPPMMRTSATVVGIGLLPDEVVQDDADRTMRMLLTPAFSEQARPYATYGLQGLVLAHGSADIPALANDLSSFVQLGDVETRNSAVDEFHAQQAVRPLAITLALFGAIAGVAGLVLVAQAISRLLLVSVADQENMRVFGARPATVAGGVVIGPLLAILGGLVIAVGLAVLASPLMPIGPVRRVEAARGIDVDLTVLTLGTLVVVLVLGTWTVVSAWRWSPRVGGLRNRSVRASSLAAAAAAAGMAPPAVAGVHAATARGRHVPTRSVLAGIVIAVITLVGAITFSSSLTALVDHPHLYGWNWDVAISNAQGYGHFDPALSHDILDHDAEVAEWSGIYFGLAALDGHDTPVLGSELGSSVVPPILHGRSIAAASEIVLGPATADQLGVHIGDEVTFTGEGARRPLRVVGIATFPSIGKVHAAHTSLGVGALVERHLVPGSDLDLTGSERGDFGPNAILVRFSPGVHESAGLQHVRTITAPLNSFAGMDVLPVQRPAEIVNTDSVGNAPILLGLALMVAAMVSFVLALGVAVRQRRHELAILRTLGFTSRQIVATLWWQATTMLVVGLVIGVPLGAVAGRTLWAAFAGQLDVVSRPRVPLPPILLLVVVAALIANTVALLNGRQTRRFSAAQALRAAD